MTLSASASITLATSDLTRLLGLRILCALEDLCNLVLRGVGISSTALPCTVVQYRKNRISQKDIFRNEGPSKWN